MRQVFFKLAKVSRHWVQMSQEALLAGLGALLGWLGAQLSASLSLRHFD